MKQKIKTKNLISICIAKRNEHNCKQLVLYHLKNNMVLCTHFKDLHKMHSRQEKTYNTHLKHILLIINLIYLRCWYYILIITSSYKDSKA